MTGIDLAPALVETARERAAELGVEIGYRVGDCERLDLPDAGFDVVSSTCGIMFAPDHAATAAELVRVTRPGGRIAIGSWTPTGGLARMFRMMAPVPAGAAAEQPLRLGRRRSRHRAARRGIRPHPGGARLAAADDLRRGLLGLFSTSYGPTKTLADALGDRHEELHRAWVDFFESNDQANGETVHTREYLLVLGTRR